MNRVLRAIMGSPDNRSPSEVDRDIEEEFAFHLEMSERELIESGLSAEQARERALAKFGSPERYRRECRTITLKERIVLQRITLVMLVVVFIMAGAALAMQLQAQRQTLAAIDQIKQRLDAPAPVASVSTYQPSVKLSRSSEGEARSVALAPGEKNTALRVLSREIYPLGDELAITVMRAGERGDYQTAATMTVGRLRADPTLDIELRDGDRVIASDVCWYSVVGDVPGVYPTTFAEVSRAGDYKFTVRELLWRHQSPASTVASLTIERWHAGQHKQAVHTTLDASVLDSLVAHGDRYTIKSKYPEGVQQAKAIMARTLRPEWNGRGPFSVTLGCGSYSTLYAYNLPGPVSLSEVVELFRSRGVPDSAMRTLGYLSIDGADGKIFASVNSSQITLIETAKALDPQAPLAFKPHVYGKLLAEPPSELGKFGFGGGGETPGTK